MIAHVGKVHVNQPRLYYDLGDADDALLDIVGHEEGALHRRAFRHDL